MNNKKKLTTLIFVFPLVALFLYGLLSYMFLLYTQHKNAQADIIKYENTLMKIHKTALEEKLNSLSQFIHYYDSKTSYKIREDSATLVEIATDIAENIIKKYKNKLSDEEIKKLIRDSLENLTFEDNLGYLFILDKKGKLFFNKDIEGKTPQELSHIKKKAISVSTEFEKEIKDRDEDEEREREEKRERDGDEEGYVDYYWYIENDPKKKFYYKISYIRKINKFNWYIGAGEYPELMKKRIKSDVLHYIKINDKFKNGFLVVSDSDNNIVFAPKDFNITKEKVKKYRIDGVYQDENIFAYTKYIPEYDWYITAVKDLKDIKKSIELKKKENENILDSSFKTNLYIMFATWLLSIILSIYLSIIINKMLKKYDDQIKSTNDKLIFQSRQALLGDLLPMIAHQWRQPINKIASIIALLRFDENERKDEKKLDAHYRQIEDNVEFMSETIDDFREFYQPKQSASVVNLKSLIEKSIEFIESAIRKKDIKLITDLDDINYTVYVNEFLQVMINLIKNAVDALDEGGVLEIKLYKEKGLIKIEVKDNGKGIKEDMLDKIFEPYVSTKKSMGLGLYMSKIIIEKHMKGELVASNNPNGGACFTITFKPE